MRSTRGFSASARSEGFTLVELLVVISVIAILSVVGFVAFSGVQAKAKDTKIKADLNAIKKAYEANYDPTANGGQGGYRELRTTDFAGNQIPGPYTCDIGPDATCTLNPSNPDPVVASKAKQGYKVSAQLSSGTYIVTSNQGTLADQVTLSSCDVLGTLNNGLVGYWKFDESSGNASDYSGSGYTLTNNNIATYITGKFGNSNSAHLINSIISSSNQYFSRTNPATIHTGANGFTFSAWVWMDSVPAGNRTIVGKGGGGEGNEEFYIIWQQGSNKFSANLGTSSGGFGTGIAASTFGTVTTNTWYFIALTFNGTNSVTISVNNIADTATVSSAPVAQSSNLYIGSYNNAPNIAWDGRIDDVRFYNHALSPSEISVLYNGGLGCIP